MRENLVVLLTATLDPGGFSEDTKRPAIAARLGDYAAALRFWRELDDPRISGLVFCENSGAREIETLEDIARGPGKEIEILSFVGNQAPGGAHYGYAELGTLDHAFACSRLMRRQRLFLKATGRLLFPNVSQLLDALPDGLACALDLRRAYRREAGVRYRARTQLMLFARDFYQRALFETRDGMIGRCSHIEEWLPQVLRPLYDAKAAPMVLRLPLECEIAGVQGSNARDYQGLAPRLKRRVRGALRAAAPGLWL